MKAKKKAIKRFAVFFAFYGLLPLISLEIFAQFLFQEELKNKTWIGKLRNNTEEISSHPLGITHTPNSEYQSISPFVSSDFKRYQRDNVWLRTDKYGSIKPSSLEYILDNDISNFTLFCGGSVTEGWAVPEGLRIPDSYSKISGTHAVNLAKGGKTLNECIDTIQSFFITTEKIPSKIIIANNVNALMDFGRFKVLAAPSDPPKVKKLSFRQEIHKLLLKDGLLPGTYWSLHKIKHALSNDLPMEASLKEKCCHGAADINSQGPNFDWNSGATKKSYEKFLAQSVSRFVQLLKENRFPVDQAWIFLEPNSFGLKRTVGKTDYRQKLTGFAPNNELSLEESKRITDEYDQIYASTFSKRGFNVVEIEPESLKGEYFYDAVHLTAKGTQFVGEQISNLTSQD